MHSHILHFPFSLHFTAPKVTTVIAVDNCSQVLPHYSIEVLKKIRQYIQEKIIPLALAKGRNSNSVQISANYDL